MDFYTTGLRKSAGYRVALCLENGLVGQGINQEAVIKQLNKAIASFLEVYKIKHNIYHASLIIE
ncbi:type II toxin-antitoxin system HicB family antitoxin [Nostoc sp. CHAB 5824]|nr:type II toxin-antitoxin system HicB family antitoxin [Nostoc sp. CHAB 5824]